MTDLAAFITALPADEGDSLRSAMGTVHLSDGQILFKRGELALLDDRSHFASAAAPGSATLCCLRREEVAQLRIQIDEAKADGSRKRRALKVALSVD